MPVTIYLRAIKCGSNDHLAMYDSNRAGAIDDLITIVNPGYTIYWKKDRQSGIKKINKIYSSQEERVVFSHHPTRVNDGFKLHVLWGINKGRTRPIKEKYFIECTLTDHNTLLKIDPFIKIPPPPPPEK